MQVDKLQTLKTATVQITGGLTLLIKPLSPMKEIKKCVGCLPYK